MFSAPFVSPPTEGKPHVPKWVPPEPTKMEFDWAKLKTLDLSLLNSSDPADVERLVATAKAAMHGEGFMYLENYGISYEQLMRQFDLGQYLHQNISEEDKERLKWNPEAGTFAGFKRRTGWKAEAGKVDGIEQFNFYHDQFQSPDAVPTCIQPFMDEITAFCRYLTDSVNRRLLTVLSKVLELPDDYLWDHIQSKDKPVGQGYFRHALFYPVGEEHRNSSNGLRMNGHTDYGLTTLLFSVPITALQVWGRDEEWHYVKYNPGALVINIGDVLEVVSGGHFKATRHRVFEPPEDQRHEQRLSLVMFQASEGSLRVQPADESPLLQREGYVMEQGVFFEFHKRIKAGLPIPTTKEWRESQVADIPEVTAPRRKIQIVNGKKFTEELYQGVKVLLPL
ncbi:hypothetical protein Q5752_007098 [Cryptotrichosporon argae]